LSTVLTVDQSEQLRGVINESSPAVARDEGRVGEKRCQEGDVGLDATNSEFDQGTKHLSADNLVGGAFA
jgi:hypothetical protein